VILAIDIGNTRSKWGVFDANGRIHQSGVAFNENLAEIALPEVWRTCAQVIVANVAGEEMAEKLKAYLAPLAPRIDWVKSTAQFGALRNTYDDSVKLGIDRWAALIAAYHSTDAPCLVVNAGTALTVDAICQNAFIGGVIAPGFHMLHSTFIKNTAAVDAAGGVYQTFPKNTQNAAYTGALLAMAGPVAAMYAELEKSAHQAPVCIVTGGDRIVLIQTMKQSFQINAIADENLVLIGLFLMSKAL
jgi:type III pantothenate kinase